MQSFFKNYATPLVIAGFAAIGTTGLIMFFDLDAPGLKDVHRWIGILFVLAALAHVVWNWRGVTVRFRQARTVALVAALCLVAAVIIGAVQFGYAGHRGPNGIRLALDALSRAPLSSAAPALGLTPDEALARLKARGIAVSGPQQSLRDIANSQHRELGALYGAVMGTGASAGHDNG